METRGKEAPLPLHIAITLDHANAMAFRRAVEMVMQLLSQAQASFAEWCGTKGFGDIWREELWRFWEVSNNACEVLSGLLPAASYPHEGRANTVIFRRPWHRYFYANSSSATDSSQLHPAVVPLLSGAAAPSTLPPSDLPPLALSHVYGVCSSGLPHGLEDLELCEGISSHLQEQQPVSPAAGSQGVDLWGCAVSSSTTNVEDAHLKVAIEQDVATFLSQCESR